MWINIFTIKNRIEHVWGSDRMHDNLLEINLNQWGYEVLVVDNGNAAWEELQKPEFPKSVISD